MILVLVLLSTALSKSLRSTIELSSENPSGYLTKFGVDLGTGKFELKLKLFKGNKERNTQKTLPVKLRLYRDIDWDTKTFTCENENFASQEVIQVPADGRWSELLKGEVGEKDTPHIWFFMIADCENVLGNPAKLKADLKLVSGDDSHLSVEMKGMKRIYLALCVLFIALLGRNLWALYKHFTTKDEIESNIVLLNIAIFFQFVSQLCHIFNIMTYEYNGKGVGAFELLGNSGGFVSEFLMITMLALIAEGWTITYKDFPVPEIYIPVIMIVGMVNLVLALISRISEDAYYLFSSFEGTTGVCILVFRLLLLGWFVYQYKNLLKEAPASTHSFLKRFGVMSGIYIMGLPLIIYSSQVLAPYKRHKAIVGANLLVQSVTMLVLSWLFTTNSRYYKISTMSNSMLPTSKSHVS